tara:strand:- start:52405 stop:52581 length:177 start_codon:yes stop_codon:yes gene_type:complete
MLKKENSIKKIIATSYDKEDGFDFLCCLEQQENYHGDKNLEKSCLELSTALRRKNRRW